MAIGRLGLYRNDVLFGSSYFVLRLVFQVREIVHKIVDDPPVSRYEWTFMRIDRPMGHSCALPLKHRFTGYTV